jgi:hypothetical protein
MHNRVINHGIVVNDGSLVVNGRNLSRRQAMVADVVRAEVAKGDESKGVDTQAEAEACPH